MLVSRVIRDFGVMLVLLSLGFILSGCNGTSFVQNTSPGPASVAGEKQSPVSASPSSLSSPQTAELQWLGQSAFLITSSQGTKILIDPPNAATGYTIAPVSGVDSVLVSHEHADHNNIALATGSPLVLRGLSATGWNSIDQKVKDVRVFSISPSIPVYHDSQQGAQRGRNTIFILEMDGLRLAHFGDLGHVLTPEMVQAIGPLDIAIIPVGGSYTIDSAAATQVVSQLNPKLVVPMHYKTAKMAANWPGVGVEPFLEGKKVDRPNSSSIKLNKSVIPNQTTIVVLNYE
jgi:L-ascorbate metabolism protein UlaG (beta-lactamase superfamily)